MSEKVRFPIIVKRPGVKVKIYRVSNRAGFLYQVTDYSGGSRRLRSFADLTAASTEAELIATKMANGETEALKLTSADRAALVRANDHLKPTGTPLEVATSIYARAFEILGGDLILEAARAYAKRNPARYPSKTVAEVRDECLKVKEQSGASRRYLQDLRYRFNRLSEAFNGPLSSITGDRIQDWFDAEKFSAQSRVNFRRVIHLFIGFAKRRGYLPKDWDELERLEKIKVRRTDRIEIFTPEEIGRLLNAASSAYLPALAIGAFAGLRTAEIERLDWSEIRLAEKLIEVTAGKAKTGSRRLVPVSANLVQWLTPFSKKKGQIWPGGRTTICDAQAETANATASEDVEAIAWKRNALRHSWISYRLAEVKDAARVALEAGNSPNIIFGHYRELVTEAQAGRWFSIFPATGDNLVSIAGAA